MSGSHMKTPPFLLAAGLLFWGWQSDLVLEGALMAVVIEGARWSHARWEFSHQDFGRVRNFCILLSLAALVFSFSNNQGPADFLTLFRDPTLFAQRTAGAAGARTLAAVVRWLPMLFFLLMLTQAYHSREAVPLEALAVRRRTKKGAPAASPSETGGRTTDLSYPYFVLCLFAASVHPSEDTTFFWGVSALGIWALWPLRSRRFGPLFWAGSLAAAVSLGYAGQHGLGRLQGWLASYNPRWFSHSIRGGADPLRSKTGLGHIGRLKGSGRIVVRLTPEAGRPPQLLREAGYRTYKSTVWYSETSTNDFVFVTAESNKTSWVLAPGKINSASVNIAAYLPGGRGLLPLPTGCGRLDDLFVFTPPQKNDLGAVLAEGPGLVEFDALYGPGSLGDSGPNTNNDEAVTLKEIPALDKVIDEMKLAGLDREQKLQRIVQFFEQKFRYSVWQGLARPWATNETPLSAFLLRRRAGHCEYFATATVLLLRRVGIPARYAVGYSVHEKSGAGYIVRQRDAHAWCLVWNDKLQRWDDFDTTPATWMEAEAKRASPWEFLADAWWRLTFELARLRWGQTQLRVYLLWGLAPVLGLLLYQIIFRRRRRLGKTAAAGQAIAWPGLDSEFYQVERRLAARGLAREAGEPLSNWLGRAAGDPGLAEMRSPLMELVHLHYRYRFDPLGLTIEERQALQFQAKSCLASMGSQRPRAIG